MLVGMVSWRAGLFVATWLGAGCAGPQPTHAERGPSSVAPPPTSSAPASVTATAAPSAAPSAAAVVAATTCGTGSAAALARCVEPERIERDLRAFAKPRPPGSPFHAEVRRLCRARLSELGFQVELHQYGTGANVVGLHRGADEQRVLVSAHYDHIQGCSGADDNASGLAAMLEVARVLAPVRAEHTLVAACWDEEERGLIGSNAYALRARKNGEAIAIAVSLDGIGSASSTPGSQKVPAGFDLMFPSYAAQLTERQFRADFAAVVGDAQSRAHVARIEAHATSVGLPTMALALNALQQIALADAHRSDHASFWLHGYPGLIVTDTANFRNPRYHCGEGDDTADTVDFAFTAQVARAVTGALAEALGSVDGSPSAHVPVRHRE